MNGGSVRMDLPRLSVRTAHRFAAGHEWFTEGFRRCGGSELARQRPPRLPVGCEGEPAPLLRRARDDSDAKRQESRLSSAFWKRLAWERSALARVSNQSATSSKPSSRALFAMPGYMSVYS